MRRRNRRVAWLTLLVSLLAVPPSVVMAQDFTTGVVVGTILADDGDDKQEAANNDPQSQTPDRLRARGYSVVTRVETFPANQWRQVDGDYFICPGKYKDWSSFKDSEKCRVRDDGFNGWAGGTVPGQEQPIQKALEQKEGRSVRLKSIEVNDDTLTAKYQYVAPGQSTNEAEQAPGTTEEPEQQSSPPASEVTESDQGKQEEQQPSVSSGDPFGAMADSMVSFMDSTLVKILAGMMLIFGLISGIARQSVGAMVMGIAPAIMLMNAPAVFEAILGMDGASTGGAATQVPGEPSDGGASMLWMILALAIPPIAFSVYRAWQNRRDEELDELMRDYAARQAGETPRRPRDEPASLDELAQRQRDNEQANEPVVVSTASSAPKVKEEEPLELQPGKRKIILD